MKTATAQTALLKSSNRAVWRIPLRVLNALITVWAAATISFFLVKMLPGDPVSAYLGPITNVSKERQAEIRESLGLNDPLLVQYFNYLQGLSQFDLGNSYQQNQDVIVIIGRGIGPTVEISVIALLFAVVFVALGQFLMRAKTPWGSYGTIRRRVVDAFNLLAVAVPTYWLGFLLLMVFSFGLGLFPSSAGQGIRSAILPGLALGIPVAGYLGQVLSVELDAAELKPYALTSYAKSMTRGSYALQHGLKNAAIPTASLVTNIVGSLLGGAVLVETVFARSGLGKVVLDAITMRDMPVILGFVFFSTLVFALLGVLLEIFVSLVDPRQR